MPELIERAKVLEYLTPRIKTQTPYGEGYNMALENAAELVALMPTIEAEPVRHGKWHPVRGVYDLTKWVCSLCGHYVPNGSDRNYCPNCGAKMDGGADNG